MNWEIVVGIITLIGAIIPICRIVKNNTAALTEVSVSLRDSRKDIDRNTDNIDELQTTVNNHETRITVLEKKP